MSDYLGLAGKTIVVFGLKNKKSVASHVARELHAVGATVVHVVRSEERGAAVRKMFGQDADVHLCDVEKPEDIERVAAEITASHPVIHGLVHSIAFANYEGGPKPFEATPKEHFLQAVDISCYSLLSLVDAFKPHLDPEASVVPISISSTTIAAETYGYMAPIKAALDTAIVFLAKSFSAHSRVRFNTVKAGPLKTSASAGIPGYLENYLFAEMTTLRGAAVRTEEVAHTVLFLLSPRSAGINGQGLVVDAGMGFNSFDREVVRRATRTEGPGA